MEREGGFTINNHMHKTNLTMCIKSELHTDKNYGHKPYIAAALVSSALKTLTL